jgi:DNA repair exonuclease SbcCD ATPase subunit
MHKFILPKENETLEERVSRLEEIISGLIQDTEGSYECFADLWAKVKTLEQEIPDKMARLFWMEQRYASMEQKIKRFSDTVKTV